MLSASTLETPEPGPAEAETGHSSSMFEGVEFFSDVLPVLRLCDGSVAEDTEVSEDDVTAAMVVALSSDVEICQPSGCGHGPWPRRNRPRAATSVAGEKGRDRRSRSVLGHNSPAVH